MWKATVSVSLLLTCSAAVLAGVIHEYGEHQYDDHLQQPESHLSQQQHQHQSQSHQHTSQFEPYTSGAAAPALHEAENSKTHHDHKVEHKHAISHQSFKIHHFHPVPVYVKKDKHPIEIGGVKHKLKQVHPETEKHHGYGLVLENHTDHKHHEVLHDDHQHHHEQQQHHEPISATHHHQPIEPIENQHHKYQLQPHQKHHAAAESPPQHDFQPSQLDYQPSSHHDDGVDFADDATGHYQYHDINTQHGGHYE